MNENSTPPLSTIELKLETAAVLEVHGQKLYIDRPFAELWDSFWLTTDDIRRVAVSVCEWLRIRGWFMPQPGIVFGVDLFPDPENLFSFKEVQIGPRETHKFTAVINAHRNALEKHANRARRAYLILRRRPDEKRSSVSFMDHSL
jgi:hypothetical protein